MKRMPRIVSALSACALLALTYSPLTKMKAAEKKTAIASTPGTLDAQNARSLALRYSGDASAVSALRTGAVPTALTSGDFDFDGAPDLVAGYRTANGGVVTLTRGNPDAFAPKDPRWYQKALHGKVPPTFVSTSTAIAVPESPDFLAAADFTGAGHVDLLVAKRGGGLYLLTGDHNGNLAPAERVSLPGDVTALAVNGAGHMAVGISSGGNTEVLVFNPRKSGGINAPVATHALDAAAAAAAIEWGSLGNHTSDLAVAYGSKVEVIYSALDPHAQRETVEVGVPVQALTIGDFVWDRENRMEIAAQTTDGAIHVLQHGVLDTRPMTAAEGKSHRAQMMARAKVNDDATSVGAWKDSKQFASTAASASGIAPHAMLKLQEAFKFGGMAAAVHELPATITGTRMVATLNGSQVAPTLLPPPPAPLSTVTTTTDEDDAGACSGGSGTGPDGHLSLREAICEANNTGGTSTITVPAGTFSLGAVGTGELQAGINPGTNITITGNGAGSTIIQQTDNVDRVVEVDPNYSGSITVAFQNLTMSSGKPTSGIDAGFGGGAVLGGGVGDLLTLSGVTISNSTAAATDDGGGVSFASDGALHITNSTITGNVAGQSGGALFFSGNAGTAGLTITGSTFTNNQVTAGAPSQGGAIALEPSSGNTLSISGSTFTGNNVTGAGAVGGAFYAIDSGVTVSNSRIVGNTAATSGSGFFEDVGTGSDSATVTNNWWGCNAGPGGTGCDTVTKAGAGESDSPNPWLVLSIGASPTSIVTGGTSTLTADLTHNSNNVSGFSVPNTTSVSFGGTLGTDSPTSTTLTSGQATSTFTATGSGSGTGTATVDNQTVSVGITITGPALSVSQSAVGTFTQGQTGQWQITVSNTVVGTNTSGTVTLTDNLPGGYTLNSFTGTDWSCGSVGPTVTCTSSDVIAGGSSDPTLTLTVNIPAASPPSVTNTATASGGNASTSSPSTNTVSVVQVPTSVTVNGSATQSANVNTAFGSLAVTVKDAGNVPISGFSVTFTAPGAGASGTFSNSTNTITVSTNGSGVANPGTFTANGTGGSYTVSAVAGPASTNFNLSNIIPPTITSANTTTFTVGSPGSFTVTATGTPAPTFSETGALPTGITLTGGGLLSGTPAAGTAGSYPITITASNGGTPNATQPFTLVVAAGPTTATMTPNAFSLITAINTSSPTYKATLQNTGGSVLTISGTTLTGTGSTMFSVTPSAVGGCSTPVNPGNSCTFDVVFSPTARGTVTALFTVSFNGGTATLSLTGRSPIGELTPGSASFGNVILGGSQSRNFTVMNTSTTDTLNVTGVSVGGTGGSQYSASGCTSPVAPGGNCVIVVTFTPTAQGPASGVLQVANDGGITPLRAGLIGTGAIGQASVSALSFGTRLVGSSTQKMFNISNLSTGALLHVSGFSFSGAGAAQYSASGCGAAVSPGSSCTVTVTFAPTTKGFAGASLNVTNDGGASPLVISVSGIASNVQLSTTALSYGYIALGTPVSKTVTIANVSTTDTLNITGLNFTPSIASEYGTSGCASPIAPLGNCVLTVTFTPNSTGTQEGFLSIGNDGGVTPLNVEVVGVGH